MWVRIFTLFPTISIVLSRPQPVFQKFSVWKKSSRNYSPVPSKDDIPRSQQSHIHDITAKVIILLLLLVSYILSNHCKTSFQHCKTRQIYLDCILCKPADDTEAEEMADINSRTSIERNLSKIWGPGIMYLMKFNTDKCKVLHLQQDNCSVDQQPTRSQHSQGTPS